MSGITGPFEELDAAIKSLEAISGEALATAAAPLIEEIAHVQFAAGKSPYNRKWKRNLDGTISLRTVTPGISFRGSGSTIVETTDDILRFHARRPVAPRGRTLPKPWAKAVQEAARRLWGVEPK